MVGRLDLGTPRRKDRWKRVCGRERIAALGLGPLLDLMEGVLGLGHPLDIWRRKKEKWGQQLEKKLRRWLHREEKEVLRLIYIRGREWVSRVLRSLLRVPIALRLCVFKE